MSEILDSIAAQHAPLVQNPKVDYCQASTLRGRLTSPELRYINDQCGGICPVCNRRLHENSADTPAYQRALLQAGMKQKEEREAEARMPVAPESSSPGPQIKIVFFTDTAATEK